MKRSDLYIYFTGLAVLVLATSCAARYPRGRVLDDHAVTSIWRSGKVRLDYNYFYNGVELEPNALMGIDQKYTVQSKFWTPIDLTTERLQQYIVELDRIPFDDSWARHYRGRYQGAWVLDPNGVQVGMWYSKKDWGVFDFPGDNIIIPYPPSLRIQANDLFRTRDD